MKLQHMLLGLVLSTSVAAQAASMLKVEQTVVVNASADKVWDKISHFGDLGAWHPAVAKTEITSGSEDKVGAVRVLTLQDGGKITEKLHAIDAKKMMFKYSIVEGVLPVSHYVSVVSVKATGADKSVVTWSGNFKRKDTSATPAKGLDDEAATTTITSVYRGGLDNLKKILE